MTRSIIYTFIPIFCLILCADTLLAQKRTKVVIHTTMGKLTVELYDETPLHRDNFIKLAKSNFYDSTLLHRVIKDFMVQGGDPNSKNADKTQQLGLGGPGYTIPAEFNSRFIHKKGALAAARTGDQQNPQKASSGSQFYIVHGSKLDATSLKQMEDMVTNKNREKVAMAHFGTHIDSLKYYNQQRDSIRFTQLRSRAIAEAEKAASVVPAYTMPDSIKNIYQTIGGAPSLDGEYTVFGEVIDGLDVIDKIAASSTGRADRPLEDIKIWMEVID